MPQLCNVCGGALQTHLPEVRDPLTAEAFTIGVCCQCGLGHTLPQPENLGRYYAATYYGNRHGFTLGFCMKRRLRLVASALPGGGGRLLDIGCGDGSFLRYAAGAGWQVMGTELNPGPAREAGFDVREEIGQVQGDRSFDCITMWHTLEHMRDIPYLLRQVDRLLKPAGKAIIAVPDFGGLQAKTFRDKWVHLDVPRHLYHFDRESLQSSLVSAGFLVTRRWHQEFEYDLLGWSQSALNRLMPHQNLFLDTLGGKKVGYGRMAVAVHLLMGAMLSAIMIPLVFLGTLTGRGGTFICVAEKKTQPQGQERAQDNED